MNIDLISWDTSRIPFDKIGYYFTGLIVLALVDFWPSYFSHFVSDTVTKVRKSKEPFYFHFHATAMVLWIVVRIAQPILIKEKELAFLKMTD